jgi:hypothetical protein
MLGLTTRDLGRDAPLAEEPPVLVVVVAAVSGDPIGPSPRSTDLAADRRDAVNERDHEAFLAIGCCLICFRRLRPTLGRD